MRSDRQITDTEREIDAVETGDPVPFGLGLAVAFAVLEAARGSER